MKNIFVTGAAGFLGRFLVKELKKNYKVDSPSSVECNLLNFKDLKKIKKNIIIFIIWLHGLRLVIFV